MIETVSLQLAKDLKEAGFPQEWKKQCFYWTIPEFNEKEAFCRYSFFPNTESEDIKILGEFYVSPTAEEILEKIPLLIHKHTWKLDEVYIRLKAPKGYKMSFDGYEIWEENLAECAGKMWLYLKKNNLLPS